MTAKTLRFHHVGVIARALEADTRAFAALGYEPEGLDFVDEIQGVSGRFLVGPGPRVELLIALPESHVLDAWRGRGSTVYHQGYEVEDIETTAWTLERVGAIQVSLPVPAVAFRGRRICFVMLRNLMLVELIEAGQRADIDGRMVHATAVAAGDLERTGDLEGRGRGVAHFRDSGGNGRTGS